MMRPALRLSCLTLATGLAFAGAAARAATTPEADAAFLDAVTWGVSPASHAELRAKGRERWLREQLHPPAGPALPEAAQAQVDALMPKGTLLERISALDAQARAASAEPDPDAKKAAQQASRGRSRPPPGTPPRRRSCGRSTARTRCASG